jgi:hypothetical protein
LWAFFSLKRLRVQRLSQCETLVYSFAAQAVSDGRVLAIVDHKSRGGHPGNTSRRWKGPERKPEQIFLVTIPHRNPTLRPYPRISSPRLTGLTSRERNTDFVTLRAAAVAHFSAFLLSSIALFDRLQRFDVDSFKYKDSYIPPGV